VITQGLVWRLGLSQLLCWGLSYYLIGVLGERIVAETGWSATLVYSGFSGALVVMGLASPLLGRFVDQHGGRPVMMAGSLLLTAGCVGLSLARDLVSDAAAWACLGLAMRMTLYEAAFAALARIGGASAHRPIAQITLLGGLASTVFWPVGNALAEAFGWRGAALAYAGIALLTLPLHATIPDERHGSQPDYASVERKDAAPLTRSRGDRLLAGALYALMVSVAAFLNSGMSAHMISILTGLGLSAGVAVWAATQRGVGQSLARLCEVLFGGRLDPLALGLLASSFLPVAFVAGLFGGASALAGAAFAFAEVAWT